MRKRREGEVEWDGGEGRRGEGKWRRQRKEGAHDTGGESRDSKPTGMQGLFSFFLFILVLSCLMFWSCLVVCSPVLLCSSLKSVLHFQNFLHFCSCMHARREAKAPGRGCAYRNAELSSPKLITPSPSPSHKATNLTGETLLLLNITLALESTARRCNTLNSSSVVNKRPIVVRVQSKGGRRRQ